ncbi:hypothetical protein AGMMS50276_17890 [Synergistales bacterium]|nr:hypothetical protein AGMMS50276_17890 [Synergistales bacterium]
MQTFKPFCRPGSRRKSVFSPPCIYFSLVLLIFTLCGAVFAPIAWGAPTTIDVTSLVAPQTITPGDYIITGATSAGGSIVTTPGTYNISLNNATINLTGFNATAFDIVAGATVNLTLVGTNSLTGFANYAGIHVPLGATLNISGAGSLFATSSSGAGIGGNNGGNGGTINISGGTVTASGNSGAGIGGGGGFSDPGGLVSGPGGNGGTINISGGTVTASGNSGAGIGGGGSGTGGAGNNGGNGGTINISGGTVIASALNAGAGIGGGSGSGSGTGGGGGIITISGNAIVTATRGSTATYDIGPGSNSFGIGFGSPATVTITGGSVEATNNSISDTPINASGDPLTLYTYSAPTIGDSYQLSVRDAVGGFSYQFTAPSPGPAHLWLPSPMNIIEIMNAQANGSPGTETSTLISFDIFNISPPVIADLSASNFWLNSATGQATLGSLHSGNINPWTIDIASVSAEGRVYFGLEPPVGYAYLLADLSFDVYKAADSSTFVPVTNIINVPTLTPERTPLKLSGTVEPSNATYKTIVWSVLNAGATGATVSGDTLNTKLAGTVNVLATITNGLAVSPVSTDYKQSFDITVRPLTAPELIAESIRDNSGLDAIASGDVITVSGDKVGASTLTIDTTQNPGVIIQWNASYKGSLPLPLVIVRGSGVIELGVSANISNTMGSALTSEGDIIISGAVIEANGDYATAVFSEKNISMSSGSVFANGMDGMALFAAGNVTLTGGSLSATGERGLAVHALGTLTTNDSALITPSQAIKAEGGITHIDSNNSKGSGGGCDVGVGFGAIALALALVSLRKK